MKQSALTTLEKTLKLLAKWTLRRYKPGIIGITGNVGKTSTKEAISIVFERERRVRSASKNFNNELGLPLTILGDWEDTGGVFFWMGAVMSAIWGLVWKNRDYPEILILEYGIDHPGDMRRLLEIARPHIGVVTAIGETPVHVEFFAGKEALVREKARLVQALPATGFAVINADNKAAMSMREQTRAHIITYGYRDGADIQITETETNIGDTPPALSCKLSYSGSTVPVRIEMSAGRAAAYAVAGAAASASAFGINLVKVAEHLSYYQNPLGRLRVIEGQHESTILDDTYNSSPLAAEVALEALREIKAKRKVAVLGDMLELGKDSIKAHEEIGRLVPKSANILVTVGEKAQFLSEAAARAGGMAKKNIMHFKTTGEAGRVLEEILKPGDLVLVKGSQGMRMERVVKRIMAEPEKAEKLLVRQSERWQRKPGLYDKE